MDFHHIGVSAVRRRLVIDELRFKPSPRGARLHATSALFSIQFYKDDIVAVVVAFSVNEIRCRAMGWTVLLPRKAFVNRFTGAYMFS